MLGINFIGLSYLLVYVGAVSILFLFILMLINIRISELVTNNSNSIPLAIMIGIFFNLIQLIPSTVIMPSTENEPIYEHGYNDFYLNTLSFVTSHS
jgi:NADH-ubiquinone oxidoreductase chain 6